jgi:Ca-activated chloride channel family protein
VRRAIRQIETGGSTNLHGGWFKGAEELAPHTRADVTSRVILLSDGCANAGLTDAAAINAQCAEFARAGISTSTYGLGRNFNEDLMIGMARSGQGNTYYGQTADDLLDDYVADGEGAWLLPSLAFGGEAWAVVRARVPKGHAGGAFNAIAEDELVVRRADELAAAGLQVRAREAARRGDWDAVGVALAGVERIAERNEWVKGTLQELRELEARKDEVVFAKESAFLSHRMSSRLAVQDESGDCVARSVAPSYLRRKERQGKGERR